MLTKKQMATLAPLADRIDEEATIKLPELIAKIKTGITSMCNHHDITPDCLAAVIADDSQTAQKVFDHIRKTIINNLVKGLE